MRSRERLIDVLRSIPDVTPGTASDDLSLLIYSADALEDRGEMSAGLRKMLWAFLGKPGQSPHYRELAKELLSFRCSFAEKAALEKVTP